MASGGRPQGFYIGLCIALFLPLGVPLAFATGNFGLVGVGLPVGVAVGVVWEKRHESELRPLSSGEQRLVKYLVLGLSFIFLLGLVALVYVIFFL
jgi:hypothetical protein